MNEIKPNTYTLNEKILCDRTDKKNCLIQYKMLKFLLRHEMIVDKVHELVSFRHSK